MKDMSIVKSICQEFTDIIITDKQKNSIIFHVPSKYFKEINKRLTQAGLELIFKKSVSKGTYTCTYASKKEE